MKATIRRMRNYNDKPIHTLYIPDAFIDGLHISDGTRIYGIRCETAPSLVVWGELNQFYINSGGHFPNGDRNLVIGLGDQVLLGSY